MTKIFLRTLIISGTFLFVQCGNLTEKKNTAILTEERLFCDTSTLDATILFNGNNVLRIRMQKDTIGDEPVTEVATTIGFYKTIGDTIYLNCPDFSSKEFLNIKTRYFWVDSGVNSPETHFFKDPLLIADSLFKRKFSYEGSIECIFKNGKAVIKGDKIIYLPKH